MTAPRRLTPTEYRVARLVASSMAAECKTYDVDLGSGQREYVITTEIAQYRIHLSNGRLVAATKAAHGTSVTLPSLAEAERQIRSVT